MVTRDALEAQVRKTYKEAHLSDPHFVAEITESLLGRNVFVWTRLSVRDLFLLHRALWPTVLRSRG
jgi:hypothetical protein